MNDAGSDVWSEDRDASRAVPTYPPDYLANVVAAVRDPQHPVQIGHYFIEQLIGEGGMGSVYRAQQREPIRRVVAIKVIKLGMDTRETIARFAAERQALALMDHPNLAKVFDAGVTENGRPYFVMEFVDGEPITSFCDREKLDVHQRLKLFVQACEAVQHAHQKAIVHRDLKPTNILVTGTIDQPRVKVIDFGVAKALGRQLTEKSIFTESGRLMGTPEYMAPEQADARDVDTRSDVYSLGVVLYELIAGALPIDATALRGAGYAELQRIIREVDPPRPSTRLSTLGETGNEIARRRRTALTQLCQQLKNELEWIPLKAMRKEPAQRYSSARELSEDIENYLNQRPLRAGPESRAYRTRKFLKRNKTGVAASAAMMLLLLAGITATTWEAIRATRAEKRALAERDNATATLDFLTDDVLAGATPENIPDAKVRDQLVSAMIVPAARRVGEAFSDRPLIEASIRETIRSVLVKVGRSDLALSHAQTALAIRRRELGDDAPDTISSINNLASVLEKTGHAAEAEPLYKDALARRRRLLGSDDPKTLLSLNNYAHALWMLGRLNEAETLYKQALNGYRRVEGEDQLDTVRAVNNYATILVALERFAEAEDLHRQSFEGYRRLLGDDNPQTLISLHNRAYVEERLGKAKEAEADYKQVLERRRRVLGENHPDTFSSMDQYARFLKESGRVAEALPMTKDVLERRRAMLGPDHPDTLMSLNNFAATLGTAGHTQEAEALAREAYSKAAANPSMGPNHPWTRTFVETYARCLERAGKLADAAAIRRQFDLPDLHSATRPKATGS